MHSLPTLQGLDEKRSLLEMLLIDRDLIKPLTLNNHNTLATP